MAESKVPGGVYLVKGVYLHGDGSALTPEEIAIVTGKPTPEPQPEPSPEPLPKAKR